MSEEVRTPELYIIVGGSALGGTYIHHLVTDAI